MRSIQRHLLLWVFGAASLGALLLGPFAYLFVLEELNEALDQNLRQVALSIADRMPTGDREAVPGPPSTAASAVDPSQIVITAWTPDGQRTFSSNPDATLPFVGHTGLSRERAGGVEWDVYTVVRDATVVQAAQQAAAQQEEAAEFAARLFLPFAALMGLVGALLLYALRRGLQPLDAAATDVAARSAASLAPIDDRDMPQEIRPLVRSLNGLMQRLATAFDNQRRFVADAAHELRTPVTALRLQLQMLETAPDDAARQAAMAELRSGIDRAQHLIEQLLHLSRLEPGAQVQPRSEDVPLDDLARQAVVRFASKADHRGIDLGAQAGSGAVLHADPGELTIMLNNLVENALRYTPAGGVVDVRTGLADDGRPMLCVIDNGPGIAPEERGPVFDRFRRGETAQGVSESGSGLGLAIVWAIVQRHAAEVSLHTAPSGRGLEVRVAFSPARAAG